MRWRAPWLFGLLLAACGSRTALLAGTAIEDGDNGPAPTEDGGVRARDAGGLDGTIGPSDAGAKDAPDDVGLPPIDATFRPDSAVNACPNAESTLIYIMTNAGNLVSYFPVTNAFQTIGKVSCPFVGDSRPFSMAVDRKGVAFVVFDDGHLYRVSTKTATCIETGFVLRQSGFLTFGMGFVLDDAMGDSLYVIGRPDIVGAKGHLATIDRGLNLSDLGEVQPDVSGAELTGTGDGRLFAFYKIPGRVGTAIGEIDRMTATLVAQSPLPEVEQGGGWAFAFWGGSFYTFTAPNGKSQVTRFNPANGKVEKVADYTGEGVIVGAGVSTCAPAQ